MVKLRDLLFEAKYKKQYKSLKAMRKDLDRIFGTRNGLGNIGHPRVRLKRGSEFDKVGRLQPSFIEIEGDKSIYDKKKSQLTITNNVKFFDSLKNIYLEENHNIAA